MAIILPHIIDMDVQLHAFFSNSAAALGVNEVPEYQLVWVMWKY